MVVSIRRPSSSWAKSKTATAKVSKIPETLNPIDPSGFRVPETLDPKPYTAALRIPSIL